APFATSDVDDPDLTMDFDEEPAPMPAPTGGSAAAVLVTGSPAPKPEPPRPVAQNVTSSPPPPSNPAPSPPAPAKKHYANAFMLDAGALFEQAESSAAVSAAAPAPTPGPGAAPAAGVRRAQGSLDLGEFQRFVEGDGSKGMRNSAAAIAEAAARADRALQETKTRDRVTKPEEVAQQLSDILGGSGYTRPEAHLALEQYYGEYMDTEGLSIVDGGQMGVKLQIIDPREVDLYRSGLLNDGSDNESAAVPTGLAFLDDFGALYQLGILPPADHEVQFDVDDPNLIIPGKRKVTVHLLNGQVKRGAIRKLARDDLGFRLEPQGTGRAEDVSIQQCKAIFVHLPPNAQPKQAMGRPLTVTFADRRSIQGTSDDYQPGLAMFSLIPPANPRQGQFERIIVNAAAVQQLR
ncbi:MAG: DUF6982 domain-containing protein, partial [Myxococcota bacterium]